MGMADGLKKQGVVQWLGSHISSSLSILMHGAPIILFLLALMFFYLMTSYAFASGTAKVMALGGVIIGTLVTLHVHPIIAILSVAGVTNIGCNLTTYSHARNPLALGYGYHSPRKWMINGIVICFSGFIIFMTVGLIWWSILGL